VYGWFIVWECGGKIESYVSRVNCVMVVYWFCLFVECFLCLMYLFV